MKSILRSQKGNVLISVVIAAGTSIIAMVALSQLVTNSSLATNTVQRNFEADMSVNEIRETLRDPGICLDTFGGLNPNSTNPVYMIRRGGSTLYSTTASGSPAGILVSGINRLESITTLPANPSIAMAGRGLVDVRLSFGLRGSALGSVSVSRTFKLSVITAGGAISYCSANPYHAFTDCLEFTNPPGGGTQHASQIYSPQCPAGYMAIGGGIYDSDYSNDDQASIVDFPNRRWRCRNDDSSQMRCRVICCR